LYSIDFYRLFDRTIAVYSCVGYRQLPNRCQLEKIMQSHEPRANVSQALNVVGVFTQERITFSKLNGGNFLPAGLKT
jgi:hypothetical protein